MHSLNVEHRQQEAAIGCLAACAQMALAYLGIAVTQTKLNHLLGLTPAGVPASHLTRIERYSVRVQFQKGTAEDLKQAIDQGIPPILFVHTDQLPYWTIGTQHALLVRGYDDEAFLLNDPVFPKPQRVSFLELMLAWDEFDNRYALITNTQAKT